MNLPDPDALEEAKKNIKKIRRAGAHAEIFGWLLLITAAGGVWLFSVKTYVVVWYVALVLLGLFFVLSGKYIKEGFGRRTKSALLANSIVSFPLSFFILPIYICVQSSNNYARFKDLPEKVRSLYIKPKRLRLGILSIIALVILLILGAATTALKIRQINDNTYKPSHSASQAQPTTDLKAAYKFSINFPAPMVANELTATIAGQSVPYAAFASTAPKGGGDYKVNAYNYPAPQFNYADMKPDELATAIHTTLISLIKNMQCTLVNNQKSMMGSYAAEDASFTCTAYGGSKTGYLRLFYIGNREYAVYTIGASVDDFNSFANSFHYTGPPPQATG